MKKIFQSCHGYFCNENVSKVSIYFSQKQIALCSPASFTCRCRQLLDEWNILQLPNEKQIFLLQLRKLNPNSLEDTNSWLQAIPARVWSPFSAGMQRIRAVLLQPLDFSWPQTSFSHGGVDLLYRGVCLSQNLCLGICTSKNTTWKIIACADCKASPQESRSAKFAITGANLNSALMGGHPIK